MTGGIVTAKDSAWLLSWTINRQPQFRNQPDGHALVWVYGLFTDREGDYVKKPMRDCTGEEICEEWLYHIGVPEEKIHDLAANHCNTIPCMMPFVTAFFMPRKKDDRRWYARRDRRTLHSSASSPRHPGYDFHHGILHAHRHGSGV